MCDRALGSTCQSRHSSRNESLEVLDGLLSADRMKQKAPQLLAMVEGSVEAGIRLLNSFRPAL